MDLPKANTAKALQMKTLEIAINAQNQLFVDGALTAETELAKQLDAHPNTTPVLLRVDKTAGLRISLR